MNEQECLRLAENLRQCRSTEHKLTVREELMQVVRMPAIWLLAMATFLELGAVYAWGFWLPTLIRNLGVTNLVSIGAIASVASVVGAVGPSWRATLGPLHEPALVFLGAHLHGAAGQMSFVLAGGRFVPSMMAIVATGLSLSAGWPLLAVVATDYLPGRSRRRASRSSPPSAFLAAPCSRPCLAI